MKRVVLLVVPFALHCQWVGSFDSFGVAPEGGEVDSSSLDAAKFSDGDAQGCPLTLPDNPCSLFPLCGCKPAENCVLVDQTGATTCILPGTTPLYAPCMSDGDCPRGTGCAGAVCKPRCLKDGDCKEPKQLCIGETFGPALVPIPGAASCSAGCDFFDASAVQTSCAQSVCYMNWTQKGKCTPDCMPGTVGTKIGPLAKCQVPWDCAPGYYCVENGPNLGACAKWCASDSDCTVPATCSLTAFFPKCVLGPTTYGLCF